MFSSSVLAVSHRPQVRRLITTSSASRKLVGRFIAGDDLDTAIAPVRALVHYGRLAHCYWAMVVDRVRELIRTALWDRRTS